MSTILVTGGAGYIGSQIVRRLREERREVLVLDDLSEGHRRAVGDATLVVGDFGDPAILDRVFSGGRVRFVVHMAASSLVGESVKDPGKYYTNNVTRSLALAGAMRRHGVEGIVFSSTAAVYGEPSSIPIVEEHPQVPTNPYGETKVAFERALAWFGRAHGIRHVALRYFNAAGAHPEGDLGEDHEPESHLLPNLLRGLLRPGAKTPIFGSDYPTQDGTCVRDYVHVSDLADAHVLALRALEEHAIEADAFNLGNGAGFSVREVIDAVERVTGSRPATELAPRREGDPAILVASSERARRHLGWEPRRSSIDEIVRTAWRWHRDHPEGFADRG